MTNDYAFSATPIIHVVIRWVAGDTSTWHGASKATQRREAGSPGSLSGQFLQRPGGASG